MMLEKEYQAQHSKSSSTQFKEIQICLQLLKLEEQKWWHLVKQVYLKGMKTPILLDQIKTRTSQILWKLNKIYQTHSPRDQPVLIVL